LIPSAVAVEEKPFPIEYDFRYTDFEGKGDFCYIFIQTNECFHTSANRMI
jgi:hypothetical protein